MSKRTGWIAAAVLACVAFVSANAVLIGFGQRIAVKKLGEVFQATARVGVVELAFPAGLRLKRVELQRPDDPMPFFAAEDIVVSVHLWSLVQRELEIGSLTLRKPQFVKRVKPKPEEGAPVAAPATDQPAPAAAPAPRAKAFPIFIQQVRIIDGDLRLINEKVSDPPHIIHLGKLEGSVKRISIPARSGEVPFDFTADVFARGFLPPGQIKARGWTDLSNGDMEMELLCAAIDLPHLSPYYKKAVQDEMLQGRANLASAVTVQSKRLKAHCNLEINDLVFVKPRTATTTFFGVPTSNVVALLTDLQGHLELEFDVNVDLAERGSALKRIIAVAIGSALSKIVARHVGQTIQELVLELGEEGTISLGAESQERMKEMGKELREKLKAIFLPVDEAPPVPAEPPAQEPAANTK